MEVKQAIQIAELQTMVFGKKKWPPTGGTPAEIPESFVTLKQPRSKGSYRRPLPPASAVTKEVAVPLPATCSCGGVFDPDTVAIHERFEEDIPLPELTPDYQSRLVTKYAISRGKCLKCGKATTGSKTDLGGAQVTLGSNVRLLVCHLIGVVGLSYAQTAGLLLALYGLRVTDGEIANMLRSSTLLGSPNTTSLRSTSEQHR